MAAPISSAGAIGALSRPAAAAGPDAPAAGRAFADSLADAVSSARETEDAARAMADRFAEGDAKVGMHEVMIAAEKASIALRFATTLKNRAIEAYRELMRTAI